MAIGRYDAFCSGSQISSIGNGVYSPICNTLNYITQATQELFFEGRAVALSEYQTASLGSSSIAFTNSSNMFIKNIPKTTLSPITPHFSEKMIPILTVPVPLQQFRLPISLYRTQNAPPYPLEYRPELEHHESMRYGDLDDEHFIEMGLFEVSNSDKKELDSIEEQHLLSIIIMIEMLSWGEYAPVIREMLNKFNRKESGLFRHDFLNDAARNHVNSRKMTASVQKTLHDYLVKVDGNLDMMDIHGLREQLQNSDIKLPNFTRWRDRLSGLGLTLHGLWSLEVMLTNYTITGVEYQGTLHVTITDHFGVTIEDLKGDKNLQYLAGFRSLFILQRHKKHQFRPFLTVIDFDVPFQGTL